MEWVFPVPPPRRTTRGLRAPLVALLVVLMVFVAAGGGWVLLNRSSNHAAGATPTGTSAILTPAMAQQVLDHYWPRHEAALVAKNLPALAVMASGPAKSWEQAAVGCGCLDVISPRRMLSSTVIVPPQTRYPAHFIGEASTETDGQGWIEVLVFTKQRSGSPWLVTEDSGYGLPPGNTPTLIASLTAGFAPPITAEQRQSASHIASRWARVWQKAKNTGRIPTNTGFDLTGDTGNRVAYLAAHPQNAVQANGAYGHFRFYVSPKDPLIVAPVLNGGLLACQPVRESVIYSALPGEQLLQDPLRHNWGPSLAPGTYPAVYSDDIWQTCFLIRAGLPITVLDQDIGGSVVTPAGATST